MADHRKTKIARVLKLLRDGCNTSQDIADEMDMSVHLAGAYLWELGRRGLAKNTGRVIPREGEPGNPLAVWEPVS